MNNRTLITCLAFLAFSSLSTVSFANDCPAWLNHKVKQLHSSNMIDLCEAASNKAVLIVNTASHCGYTRQFSSLEKLHKGYKDKGLMVIGFPSDSFNQEADTEAQTADVCYKNFGVTFTMTQTVSVKGSQAHPVFQHLASETGSPSWNFNKYLVDGNGKVLKQFPSSVEPTGESLRGEIDKVLYSF